MIPISHAVAQTQILVLLLVVALLVSGRRRQEKGWFPVSVTQELKGLAILLVFFSHVGNFLVADHRFLAPLSGVSQAAVDIFLLLSGYGLSVSNLKRPQSPRAFYRRLLTLFVPFWLVLAVFTLLDLGFGHYHYGGLFIFHALFGIFLTSDLSQDFNAPLWFMTVISFYYLLYPLVFMKRRLWLSALALFAIGSAIVALKPPPLHHVMFLYQLHTLAFPLGMLLAWLGYDTKSGLRLWLERYTSPWRHLRAEVAPYGQWLRLLALAGLLGLLVVLNPQAHTTSGAISRQAIDVLFALALIALFAIKRISFKLLYILGVYSFEIYLLHWPLISRYDLLYKRLPAWIASLLYLVIIVALGYGLQRVSGKLTTKKAVK